MTNAFYNDSGNPGTRTKARSVVIREEFRLLEVGFDAVEASLNAKLNKASPASTGNFTHTGGNVDFSGATNFYAPTPGTGDNSNRVATTAFALAVLGAAGSLIPPQATHAGKALVTDGTSYSWQLILPTQTGNARKYLFSDGTNASWQTSFGLAAGGISTYTVTSSHTGEARIIDFGNSTTGIEVNLPNATGLHNGESFLVSFGASAASNAQGVCDSTGELLFASVSKVQAAFLTSNATAAGTWRTWTPYTNASLATPPACYINGLSSNLRAVPGSASPVVSIPMGGDQFLVASRQSAGLGVDIYVLTATGLTVSIGTVATSAGGDTIAFMKLLAVTGGYALVYALTSSYDIKVVGITVAGTTPTAGGAVTVAAANALTLASFAEFSCDAAGDKILIGYKKSATALNVIVVQVLGTTINPSGTPTTLVSSSTSTGASIDVVAISSTAFFVTYGYSDGTTKGTQCMIVTVSGLTTNTNVAVSIDTDLSYAKAVLISGSLALVSKTQALAGAHFARTVSISGTTLTVNAEVNTGAGGASGFNKPFAVAVGSYYAVGCTAASPTTGAMVAVSVSGVTVTVVGSTINWPGSGVYASAPRPVLIGSRLAVPRGAPQGLNLYDIGAGGMSLALSIDNGLQLNTSVYTIDGSLYKLSYGKYILCVKPEQGSSFAVAVISKYGSMAA